MLTRKVIFPLSHKDLPGGEGHCAISSLDIVFYMSCIYCAIDSEGPFSMSLNEIKLGCFSGERKINKFKSHLPSHPLAIITQRTHEVGLPFSSVSHPSGSTYLLCCVSPFLNYIVNIKFK